ncbi:ABC transporter ATP-binding protein [Roseibium sp. SCP14]|uniref:ABC transporter ATP-binding protein n=1 Tax=Roseibium sp. SCP14 TaxID=3141375 RepID=UPI003337ACAD
MATIALQNLVKRFGATEVLHSIDLNVEDGEFIVFVGPSGCGKSTTLRMIAGLESVSGGHILIGDRDVSKLVPRERNISMVFQDYALYPHMSVRKNLGFGLKVAGTPRAEIDRKVGEAAEILGLSPLLERKPRQLSGGQRQRVAMGRAIVRSPDVYLFDEPLSNLDAKLRTQMRAEIKKLHRRVGNTVIYVTHDQVEAMTMADRIVVMRDGNIEQVGKPEALYARPNNTFVATFIGSPPMNLIRGTVGSKDGVPVVAVSDNLVLPVPEDLVDRATQNQSVDLGFRPDICSPVGHELSSDGRKVTLSLTIDHIETLGAETMLTTLVDGKPVLSKMFNPRSVSRNDNLDFVLAVDQCHLFDADTGQTLRDPA